MQGLQSIVPSASVMALMMMLMVGPTKASNWGVPANSKPEDVKPKASYVATGITKMKLSASP